MVMFSAPLYRAPNPLRMLPNAGEVANADVAPLLALPLMRKASEAWPGSAANAPDGPAAPTPSAAEAAPSVGAATSVR